MNMPVLNKESEKFDTSFFQKEKMKALKKDVSKSFRTNKIIANERAYEEYDTLGNLVKRTVKSNNIISLDYSKNNFFGIATEYKLDGNIKFKGVNCIFGFNIGEGYY